MAVRGTRNLFGADADALFELQVTLEHVVYLMGYQRFIPSLLAERELFAGKTGDNRMYEFKDRSDRDLVLIPEVTAVAVREYRESWQSLPKPVRLFYTTKCFRYDRPQRGRHREFTQFGVEVLGGVTGTAKAMLDSTLTAIGLTGHTTVTGAERGQDYYTGRGWEVCKDGLQIAGGGPYADGEGWAIGLERLLLVL